MTDCSDLKAQIRKLQDYLDSTHAGTWEWNVQTGELNINERWAEIVGFERADLSPVHIDIWTWLAHPDDLERSNQALQDHFNGKSEHYDLDVRIRHKNGNWIWVHDRGQVTEWTEEGQPLWMHGTHEDVSYRVKIEHQLQALLSEERAARIQISEALKDQTDLANLLFNQPLAGVFIMMLDEPIEWHDGIDREKTLDYVFDHQRIIRVNKAMLTQYLASEDEFAGATPNQLFAHDLAQGREAWRQMFDQGHIHFETHELRFDGSEMDVIGDYICMYDSQGRITGHFGIQTDVTDQKIAERKARAFQEDLDEATEKYRLIAETTHDFIFVFNVATMTFSFISGSVETLLGYTVEEVMNLCYDQLFTQDSLRQMEQFQGHVLESFRLDPGNPVQKSFEIQHVHKDGHPVWVEVSITYRMDPRHGIEIVGASRDIDERKRRQEQILYAATHDPLTGLLNRTAVQTLSKTTIPGLDQEPSLTALLINVDKFRSVNETIGHHGGDQVIIDLSKIILSCAGSKNQVFRYSGDEFLVLTRDT
ncbi:MAG: PAS domain S-box protein, partial [Eubacteriales bacterium]|nr:PAS domain S-box protein [Eubacteriales bacterium]